MYHLQTSIILTNFTQICRINPLFAYFEVQLVEIRQNQNGTAIFNCQVVVLALTVDAKC